MENFVPAGFRLALTLHDENGRLIQFEENMRFELREPDPNQPGDYEIVVVDPDPNIRKVLVTLPFKGWWRGYLSFSEAAKVAFKEAGWKLVGDYRGRKNRGNDTNDRLVTSFTLKKS